MPGGREHQTFTYDFAATTELTGLWTDTAVATGAATFAENSGLGVKLVAPAINDSVYLHWNGKLYFDIDKLLFVEYLFSLVNVAADANTEVIFGMASAYNANPDAVAASVWALGKAGVWYGESDDGTTDVNDEPAGIRFANGKLMRVRIDFKTGIQSVSPPSKSKGGKGSIQMTMTDTLGWQQHAKFSKHLDMSAYTAGLQPYFGLRQPTAIGTAEVWVQKLFIASEPQEP